MMKKSDSPKVIITLDGDVRKFESAHVTDVGLVVPCNVFSMKKIGKLSKDIKRIRKRISLTGESYLEALHFRAPLLYFEGKDAKVLKLICNHSPRKERLPHLEQFIILKQHGIHVSKKMAKQSLVNFHEHYDSYRVSPFMVKIDWFDCGYRLLGLFNTLVDRQLPDPYLLMNLYSLVEKYPDTRFLPDRIIRVFMFLSREEREEIIYSHTEKQIQAMMGSDWCVDSKRYVRLHLERVRKNLPLVPFTFERPSSKLHTYYVMTEQEGNDFQRIIARLEEGCPALWSNILNTLTYFYLKLGSSGFEDFLQYMQQQDMARLSQRKEYMLNTIAASSELQDEVIAAFENNPELPLSIKLELLDLDEYSK